MERLDVEDDEQRQRRIQNHLEKLNSSSSAKIPTTAQKFDFGDGTTYPVAPPTELLARVQAFLPQIEASNALLAQQVKTDPLGVNMEHVDDDTGQIIEMNLGLGVFEDRSHRKNTTPKLRAQLDGKDAGRGAGAERHSDSSCAEGNDIDDDGCGSDSSSADTDFSSEIITSRSPAQRLTKPLPKRSPASRLGKPIIRVLDVNTSDVAIND